MTAVTVLLVFVLGIINVLNFVSASHRTLNMLEELARKQSADITVFENAVPASPEKPLPDTAPPPEQAKHADDKPNPLWGAFSKNEPMALPYFTVKTDGSGNITESDFSHISEISAADAAEYIAAVKDEGETGRYGNFKFFKTTSPDGRSAVYVFADITAEKNSVLRVAAFCALAGLACWGIMLLIVALLSKKAVSPIAENIENQKRFITDAGHEIKTPLAVILANTEAMELYCGENKWSKNIREQTERLSVLTGNLLLLAKTGEGVPQNTETVSLTDTVNGVLEMFSESMHLKGLELCKNISDGIHINAHKGQMQSLFSILADNAARYSKENTAVKVLLYAESGKAVFKISNTCTKLPECEPEKLFERFFRADSARNSKDGGSGIGLSAAKSIAELYGGSIRAEYGEGETVTFTVTL